MGVYDHHIYNNIMVLKRPISFDEFMQEYDICCQSHDYVIWMRELHEVRRPYAAPQ